MENKTSKINTLQGLRFIAFLAIFAWHINGYMGIQVKSWAYYAVSFFFMLSGFVSMISLDKTIVKLPRKDNIILQSFHYTKKKISKICPLYILAVIVYIPISAKHLLFENNINLLIYILLIIINFLFLQSWSSKYTIDMLPVGWYLSSLVFLNFITIFLSKLIKRINQDNKIIKNIFLILIIVLLLPIYYRIIPNNNTFYFYYYPIFRFFEYFIGMCLGGIYLKTKENIFIFDKRRIIFSIIEFITIFVVLYIAIKFVGTGFNIKNSICAIIIDILVIATFMYQKGIFSKLLSIKPLVFLGDISAEMYLLHSVFIAYIFGFAKRVLPTNTLLAVLISIFVLSLTILISYIIHYKKYKKLQKKLKTKLIHFIGRFKQKKLKCNDFTIISNNCFAGVFYRNNALEYMSPTCGLFIMPKDYIKFIYNLKEYLGYDLKQISIEESNYSDYLKNIKYNGTIGKLNDVEIMFLHYENFEEAKQKWERRSSRINYNKIIYKFNDQNECTYDDLLMFEKFEAENKLCFTAKKYDNINSIIFSEFERDGCVLNDSKEKVYKRYIDMYRYINERFGENEKN